MDVKNLSEETKKELLNLVLNTQLIYLYLFSLFLTLILFL